MFRNKQAKVKTFLTSLLTISFCQILIAADKVGLTASDSLQSQTLISFETLPEEVIVQILTQDHVDLQTFKQVSKRSYHQARMAAGHQLEVQALYTHGYYLKRIGKADEGKKWIYKAACLGHREALGLYPPFSAIKTAEQGHPNANDALFNQITQVINENNYTNLEDLSKQVYIPLNRDPNFPPFFKHFVTYQKSPIPIWVSNNLLFWLIANQKTEDAIKIIGRCAPEIEKIRDCAGNTLLHIAAFHGDLRILKIVLGPQFRANIKDFPLYLNSRNHDGTNPLGMAFLNENNNRLLPNSQKTRLIKVLEHFIIRKDLEVNSYLNNRRGMDYEEEYLKRIGGFNCLHMAIRGRNTQLLSLLETRNQNHPVNFCYPSLNPDYHMTSPNYFMRPGPAEELGKNYEELKSKLMELQKLQLERENEDDSGDSEDEDSHAHTYKESILELSSLIIEANNIGQLLHADDHINHTTLLSTPTKNSPRKISAQDKLYYDNAVIPHFHGVPFMQGQYLNHQRREVAKNILKANRKKIKELKKKTSKQEVNKQEKSIDASRRGLHSRTSTASCQLASLYQLTSAEIGILEHLNQVDERLKSYLSACWKENPAGFIEALRLYIYDFSKSPIADFWNTLKEIIPPPPGIVKYRFPMLSTSKAPDHAVKFGIGKNVETQNRGELPLNPNYNAQGYPQHRLAGLLYISFHSLDELNVMQDSKQTVDITQLLKSGQIKGNNRTNHQIETTFLGHISGKNIVAVVPIYYPNFHDKKAKKLKNFEKDYYKSFWNFSSILEAKKKFQGKDFPECYYSNTGAITPVGKIMMPTYVNFALRLAQAIATLQEKHLCFITPEGNVDPYPVTYNYDSFFSFAHLNIRGQVVSTLNSGKVTKISPQKLDEETNHKALARRKLEFENVEEQEDERKDA